MGMYTKYDLQIQTLLSNEYLFDSEKENQILKWIAFDMERQHNWDEFCEAIIESEPCKWYDHDIDMQTISRAFPEVLFILTGEPESGSGRKSWITYYFNGLMQFAEAQITYDNFDPKKLKN